MLKVGVSRLLDCVSQDLWSKSYPVKPWLDKTLNAAHSSNFCPKLIVYV